MATAASLRFVLCYLVFASMCKRIKEKDRQEGSKIQHAFLVYSISYMDSALIGLQETAHDLVSIPPLLWVHLANNAHDILLQMLQASERDARTRQDSCSIENGRNAVY